MMLCNSCYTNNSSICCSMCDHFTCGHTRCSLLYHDYGGTVKLLCRYCEKYLSMRLVSFSQIEEDLKYLKTKVKTTFQ